MIEEAYARGRAAALACVKAGGAMDGVVRNLVGQPRQVFVEGARAFRPGGLLSAKNVFWPPTRGPGGSRWNWLARGSTLALPLTVASAAGEHPEEGRLSRLLGAVGGAAGMAYGFPSLGVLGAPLLASAGTSIGHGIGHVLGSKKEALP